MAALNLRRFLAQVRSFTTRTPAEEIQKAHRRMGIAALQGVVLRTPVDTGRARANWQVANGSAPEGAVDATDPSGGRTLSQGQSVIQDVRPFDKSYIVNNLDYIVFLEEGSSAQAPEGMVAVTIAELQDRDFTQGEDAGQGIA